MLTLLFQATLDIRSRANQITLMTQFGPTMEGLIRALFFVASLLAFAYMLWGAFDWILAGGDTGAIEKARSKITQSLLGLGVLASVAVIFNIVQYMIGVNIFK